MKKIFSLLGLLMLLSSSAWADLTPTVVVENDFSSTGPLFANKSRGTVEHNTTDGNVKFTSANNTTNGYGSSTYSFGDLTKDASAVKVEFDYWIVNGACNYDVAFIIRDASVAAGHAKQAMGTAGAFFSVGRTRQSSTNFFSVNRAKSKSASADNLGVWTHVEVYVDYETKKVDYKVSQLGGNTIQEGTEVDYLSSDASKVSEIDFFYCVNNEVDYLDNLKITKYVDNSSKPTKYTVNYLNEQGQALKQAASYDTMSGLEFTASNDDMASFTNEGATEKYNYLSGNEKKVASKTESENVINLTFKTYAATEYTVKTNSGIKVASGTAFLDGSTTVYYPAYILANGVWYNTNSPYSLAITNATNTVDYAATSYKEGDIYFFESENLKVSHSPAATNTGAAYSGGKSPRLYANSYWYSEAIKEGGKFNATVPYENNNSTDGVVEIYTRDSEGNMYETGLSLVAPLKTKGTLNVSDIIVKPGYSIAVMNSTAYNSNVYMDYLLLNKTADYVASTGIEINQSTIVIGENTTLAATVSPANATLKKIKWTVEADPDKAAEQGGAAEIDENGVLTPLSAGFVKITADNGENTATWNTYIVPATFAATVTGVPASYKEPVWVLAGDDENLKSVFNEGETDFFVYTKADLDNMQNTSLLQPQGSVTATKIPTYIYSITVDKKNKTVEVVYEEDIEVTAMEFAVKDQRIAQGNSRTLQVTYYPADASFKTATWTSSNPEVATVDANTGLVTAVSEGETTITATWSENESHGTDYSAQLTLTVDKGLVLDRIVFDELDDATAEVMGYYHPMDGDTLFLAPLIESNGRMIPVSFIKQEAFIGSNLKSIVIPGTVKTIDHRALMYSNTHNAYEELPEDGLESAFLMEGVEVMRDRIFHGNKYMKKVFLPSTLTDIGYYSFFGTAIEDVYFGGSEDEWNALKNLENAKLPETAKIHFNSDFTSAFINSIEVEEESVEIAVGETYAIEATVIPESIAPAIELTYTSSNEEVATVDEEGVVTGIADGYVTITVSAGEGVEAKVRVKVGDAARDFTTPLLTTWSVQGGSNTPGVFVDEEEHYYNNWGSQAWAAQAYAQFDLSNLQPDDDFKATFTVWVNCARGTRNFQVYGLPTGTTVADCQELTAKKGVELADYTDIVPDYQVKEIDVTDYIKTILAEGGSDAIIIMSHGAAGGKIYGKGSAEFAPTLNIAPANAQGGTQTTGISEAQSNESTVKSGKYMENGQIVIYIDGKKFNAAGQQMK